MVGALIVLLAVIAGVTVLSALNHQDPPDPVQAVDYTREASYARTQASFDLVAPRSLPPGWKATTVRFTDGVRQHWHLGFLTAAGRYVGLEQADSPVRSMLEAYVDQEPSRGRPVTIGAATWATYTDAGGDLSLVRRAGRTTTLVVGHAVSKDELVGFVRSLR